MEFLKRDLQTIQRSPSLAPERCGLGFLLLIRMTELAAPAFERVSALVLVLWSWALGAVNWLSARLRRAAALVRCWRRCRRCQLAKRTGVGVS